MKRTKAQMLAGVLLSSSLPDERATPWSSIYSLENLFGVHPKSQWKSVEDAVRHAAQAPNPSPTARYDFNDHAIHVYNGDLLTRVVKLNHLKPDTD